MAMNEDLTDTMWSDEGILDQVSKVAQELGWGDEDEIKVKIAGSRVSGVHQTEGANPKWSPPFGDIRHNADAQIVIENVSRRDDTKSKPAEQA
jgi:hypothetical protein